MATIEISVSQVILKAPELVSSITIGANKLETGVPAANKKVSFEKELKWTLENNESEPTIEITLNENSVAELKLKPSDVQIKKWLKITQDGKDLGKV